MRDVLSPPVDDGGALLLARCVELELEAKDFRPFSPTRLAFLPPLVLWLPEKVRANRMREVFVRRRPARNDTY